MSFSKTMTKISNHLANGEIIIIIYEFAHKHIGFKMIKSISYRN